jgi:hypothetical protein
VTPRDLRVVSGCSSCPFATVNDAWPECRAHDDWQTGGDVGRGARADAPEWCPLRKRSIEVVLAGDE